MSEGLYVYCIIDTGEAREFGPRGVGGQGGVVTTIAYQDLSAVVSPLPMERYEVGQETMLAHQRVVERVMASHALLPARFYTVAPGPEEVRSLLRARYREFKEALSQVEGRVELGLKVLWTRMDDVLAEVARTALSGQPEGQASAEPPGASGYRHLLETYRAGVRESLLAPLQPIAVDLRLHRTYGDDMVMNAAFLVDRAMEREFDARVERLASGRADSLDLKYVGPAPPYSFVQIVIGEGDGPGGPQQEVAG